MKFDTTPIIKDLVLIGGGHSHITALKMLGMKPIPGIRITLISRDIHTPYSGMLPGYIAGHYSYDEIHIDLRPLTIFAGARLFHSTVNQIDLDNREIYCSNRPPVKYDVLSINTGSQPGFNNIEGTDQSILPIKPIDQFLDNWKNMIERVCKNGQRFNLTIVGAGTSGVEMSLATQYQLQHILRKQNKDINTLQTTLIGSDNDILKTHNAWTRKKFMRLLNERNIKMVTGKPVTRVSENQVICGKTIIRSDATLLATSALAPAWPRNSGLATDKNGFIRVNDCLQSLSHENVFAAGDIATVVNHPREKSGVFAVRQGPPLTKNLRRVLLGKQPKPFIPQKDFLRLISTGNQYAVASRGSWSLEGQWLWKIKNWIDHRFMNSFSKLPEMQHNEEPTFDTQLANNKTIQELSATAIRCGGCGAKVSGTILNRVVDRLEILSHEEIATGLHSPDDAAVLNIPPGKVMVQSVDYFRTLINDAYIFGQIAANHALGDIFAMGAKTQSALAIVTLPYGREAIVEDQMFQLMSGALSVLNESGTALIGGHSSEGAELAFGLTINGTASPDKILYKGGMQPNQAVILTKPIGTGTLLAADMRGKAKGRWVHAAIDSMVRSSQHSANIMPEHGVTACTDVTGFGLLGHLVEMAKASSVKIELNTAAIPLLDGAATCIANGIFSSTQAQNTQIRSMIRLNNFNCKSPLYSLLFDPQTAGGLLASLPEAKALTCVTALKHAGYPDTAIIGTVKESDNEPGFITLI